MEIVKEIRMRNLQLISIRFFVSFPFVIRNKFLFFYFLVFSLASCGARYTHSCAHIFDITVRRVQTAIRETRMRGKKQTNKK